MMRQPYMVELYLLWFLSNLWALISVRRPQSVRQPVRPLIMPEHRVLWNRERNTADGLEYLCPN